MNRYRSFTGLCAFALCLLTGLVAADAVAQSYPAARVRVAERGLSERQLLETLRGWVAQDSEQLATRVDLMIAAYALVNFAESGDASLEGRITAVEQAFAVYQESGAPGVKPTEGAMEAAFQSQINLAFAQLGDRPEIQNLDQRTSSLERQVQNLESQVTELAARPSGGASKKQRALAVGGMALTIASAVLLVR
jgi:hypothetical protein